MKRSRLFFILGLALGTGILAAYLASRSGPQGASAEGGAAPAGIPVVVTAGPLTAGAVVTEADVRVESWPGSRAPVGLHGSTATVVGRTVQIPLAAGQPVLEGALAPAGAGPGLPALVPHGMRAVSVAVDAVVGVSGFVVPGTRVDVLATLDPPSGSGESVTRLVVQDAVIVASGKQLQADPGGAPQEAEVVTLLVTPQQAERLVLAMHKGRIQLALRSRLDQAEVSTPGVRVGALTGGGGRPAAPAGARASAPPVSAAPTVVIAPPAAAAPGSSASPAAPSVRSETTAPSASRRTARRRAAPAAGRTVEVINGSQRTIISY